MAPRRHAAQGLGGSTAAGARGSGAQTRGGMAVRTERLRSRAWGV